MLIDLSNVTVDEFDVIPVGDYLCNVTAAEVRDTKNGSGQYIRTELTIADGSAKGRKIFTQFNIKNQNPQAVAIGLQQLKQLLLNANHPSPDKVTVQDIPGLTVGVRTKVTKSEEYGDKAEVHYFFNPKKVSRPNPLTEQVPF